ncbi:MAG: sigma-54-dependent transcriptional regulator, partial [Isosphaeraceae bacterium]
MTTLVAANELSDMEACDKTQSIDWSHALVQRILIVEDDEDTRNTFQQLLTMSLGVEVELANDGAEALEMLLDRPFSIVITDLRMPKLNGMKLIAEIQSRKLPVTVIVTTGHGSIDDAVAAMRMGAYEFLTKPPDPQQLCFLIQRALRERTLQDELAALRAQIGERHKFWNVLSRCPRMFEIFELIGQVADTTATVLIEGETGTGKEQIAHAIHQASAPYREGPFVPVHCAALSETLLESELFGHEKGAFTGASAQRKGRFEMAHGGTLFLDEVADIPMSMQVKLLRVLQEHCFERVGGNQTIEIAMRVVGATNRPLKPLVEEGKFREDLYYRLNVIKIDLPPLRQRLEDIPLLATYFAQKYTRAGHNAVQISEDAMQRLLAYAWPGNIRELENAVERACLTARDGLIRVRNLPPDVAPSDRSRSSLRVDTSRPLAEQLAELTARFEERYLRKALRKSRGHVGR